MQSLFVIGLESFARSTPLFDVTSITFDVEIDYGRLSFFCCRRRVCTTLLLLLLVDARRHEAIGAEVFASHQVAASKA